MTKPQMLIPFLITSILLMCRMPLMASDVRGGLTYTFGDITIIQLGSEFYASFDVNVSGTNTTDRLGTGIILVNYNTAVFGESVNEYHNIIVTPGEMLQNSLYPLYGLIVNDNQASRFAVTYEYLLAPGWGNRLSTTPRRLVNIKLRIQNFGLGAGLSFNQSLMSNEQYMDDNATLFSPVISTDTDNSIIPASPSGFSISTLGNSIRLQWQAVPGHTYTIYSTNDPVNEAWQISASGLSGGSWTTNSSIARKFYRITAMANPGTY